MNNINSQKYVIDVNGLEEEIRCIICENPMHTNRGCDGNCKYDESLFRKITTMLDRRIELLPFNQPEIIRCKDCKHWKDSDGVFRRGIGVESKCPLNLHQVYEGTFYCGLGERKEVAT